jgi:hypothetical protein
MWKIRTAWRALLQLQRLGGRSKFTAGLGHTAKNKNKREEIGRFKYYCRDQRCSLAVLSLVKTWARAPALKNKK